MRELGCIVRLQVQIDSIKSGVRPREQYTPHPNLVSVAALRLTPHGVVGIAEDGSELPDVHNALHPNSKHRGDNGVSIGLTGHYAAMRDRFGDHLADGIAGENVLIQHDGLVGLADVEHGVIVSRADGEIRIGPWGVAHPCAPFARFCLQTPPDAPADKRITQTLQFLDNGTRGYTSTFTGGEAIIRLGATVYTIE